MDGIDLEPSHWLQQDFGRMQELLCREDGWSPQAYGAVKLQERFSVDLAAAKSKNTFELEEASGGLR